MLTLLQEQIPHLHHLLLLPIHYGNLSLLLIISLLTTIITIIIISIHFINYLLLFLVFIHFVIILVLDSLSITYAIQMLS